MKVLFKLLGAAVVILLVSVGVLAYQGVQLKKDLKSL